MKKVFAIFAIAGLIATSSCGSKTTEEATTVDSAAVEAPAPVVEEAPVVDTAAVAADTTAATPAQ